MSLKSAMDAIQRGVVERASDVKQLVIEILTASGYQSDASDFAGFLALMGGGDVTGPVSVTRETVTGQSHGLSVTYSHLGGPTGGPGTFLGNGVNVDTTFDPADDTTVGLAAQEVVATLVGSHHDGGSMSGVDVHTVIDATRTAKSSQLFCFSCFAQKLNNVDDSADPNAALIGFEGAAGTFAGSMNTFGAQFQVLLGPNGSAPQLYGAVVKSVTVSPSSIVTQRAAGLYIGDWSRGALGGATVPEINAIRIDGGNIYLNNGDIEMGSAATGVILRSPNGTRFRVAVSDAGTLSTQAL